jgi:predicted nucleic acid-binding protein
MSQRIRLDANVILRFLRNDDARQSPAAAGLFQKAIEGKVVLAVSAVTMTEVFFVFTSAYKLSNPDAARILLQFVRAGVVEFEHEAWVTDALQRIICGNVDFGDAYLAASAVSENEMVASFDRDLQRFKDVRAYNLDSK